MFRPFTPQYGGTQSAAVGAAAGAITGLNAEADQLYLLVVGTQVVFVRVTRTADTSNATTADFPVYPHVPLVITKGIDGYTRISHIAAGAGSTLYVTPGAGEI